MSTGDEKQTAVLNTPREYGPLSLPYVMHTVTYVLARRATTNPADSVYTRENVSYNHFKRQVWAHQKC